MAVKFVMYTLVRHVYENDNSSLDSSQINLYFAWIIRWFDMYCKSTIVVWQSLPEWNQWIFVSKEYLQSGVGYFNAVLLKSAASGAEFRKVMSDT